LLELAPAIARWRYAQYDGIVALAAGAHCERGRGVISMMLVVLIAGIGLLLAGLVTVALGIQLDLSFGNTLILTGAIVACTGVIMLALWAVVRELKTIALGPGVGKQSRAGNAAPPASLSAALGDQAPEDGGFPFSHDQPAPEHAGAEPALQSAAPPPWLEETGSRDRGRSDAPPEPEAAPAVKPKRNLLFSSSSRKERERAQARTADPAMPDLRPPAAAVPSAAEPGEAPPATFDDAWPKPERARAADASLPRRSSGRAPSTFTEPGAGAAGADRGSPAERNEDQPQVTVLKSGVVDGMAYSLYSDGSIEAQMPEGMMRFASIDELRAHLDQRP
jgi:hypothetical protein